MDHLYAGEDDLRACRRLEAEHGQNAVLDAPMVLLDWVIEILALADVDSFKERRDRSRRRFSASLEITASLLV